MRSLFTFAALAGTTVAFAAADEFHRYTNYDPDLAAHTPREADFVSPSGFARPQAWWHWIGGNVSRAGIEADLREMADKGYGFARIFHLNSKVPGPLKFNSPEWFDTFRFTAETAKRYGIGLGIHACEGWSEAGGPWITPELSMKELTYKLVRVTGNGTAQVIPLPELERKRDFVRDIAVLAWPAKRPADLAMHRDVLAKVGPANADTKPSHGNTGVLFDGRREKTIAYAHDKTRPDQFCGVTLEFKEPFEAAGVFTEVQWMYELPKNIFLEASDDGVTFTRVCELQFRQADTSAEFPARRARFWRLVRYQSPDPTERVRRGVVKEHVLTLAELELLAPGEFSRAASPIDNFAAKAGVLATSGAIEETARPFPAPLTLRRDEIRDLTAQAEGGVLRWTAPAGEWVVMRAGYTTTGKTNHPATPEGLGLEVDKFDPAALDHHFAAYPQRMIDAAGPLAGDTFSIIATDSWEAGHQNWTERLPELFRARNGYDLLAWLPVYAGECIEDVATTENFLRDLRRTFSELVMENFYGRLGELVRARGLRYETEPASGIFMRSPMNSFREADIPMSEVWQDARESGVVPGVRHSAAREVASTAHFYGKQFTTCEALTSRKGNWAETPWTMKGTADTVLLAGFNGTVFHSYTHQADERAPGWQMDPWGVSLNRKLPWWRFARPWFDTIARNQYLLQQGKYAARILSLYSDEIPTTGVSLEITGNFAYDIIEGDGVRRFLKVVDGRLVSPGRMAYELLVVSPKTTLQLATLERLRDLVAGGATVSALAKPSAPPSLRGGAEAAARWRALVEELYGDGRKAARQLGRGTFYVGYTANEAAAARGIRENFRCVLAGAPSTDLGWTHREHADGTEWFWVINRLPDAPRTGLLSFRVTGKDVALWHPETGRIERAPAYFERDGYTHVPLTLERMEGVFFVFRGVPAPRAVVRAEWEGRELFSAGGPAERTDHTQVADTFSFAVTVAPTIDRKLTAAARRGIVSQAGENFVLFPEQMHVKMGDAKRACAGLSVGRNSIAVFEHGAGFLNSVLVWDQPVPPGARLAVVYTRGVPSLFVNGRPVARGEASGRIVHPPAALRSSFKGRATDFTVEAKAWSPAEALAHGARAASADAHPTDAPRLFADATGLGAEFMSPGTLRLTRADGSALALTAANVPSAQRIDGPFAVTFDPQWGGPAEPQEFSALTSWTESTVPGVKHFSGTAVYAKTFEVAAESLAPDLRVALAIEQVAEVAEVTLNGERVGVLWRPPYRIDVTRHLRAGRNELRIAVANTWVNRCLYDATLPEAERLTWANTMAVHYPDPATIKPGDYYPWQAGPLPSGLIGGMALTFTRVVRAE
ncbi:MAG: hypothetical protein KBC32_06340 [Candidatus Didemnitutus sp.]|nr:hypothetical protein [Candidatus Didemnitutus sp.]